MLSKNAYIITTILFLLGCQSQEYMKVSSLSIAEIKKLKSLNHLSARDYLKLACSKDAINSIFEEKDTSIAIFKDLTLGKVKHPVLFISGEKNFVEWLTPKDIQYLIDHVDSKQPCMNIINDYAPYANLYDSNVGLEAIYLLDLYMGKKYFNSKYSGVSQLSASIEKKEWWEKIKNN